MPPARSLAALAAVFLVALSALGLFGCERDAAPQLVSLTEVTPREVEVGDRVEIGGAGFPQGKTAHLTFEGTLRRPGEPPLEGAVVTTEAPVSSSQTVDLAYTDALQAAFCGSGERARHTAFDGRVTVAFAAVAPGAPPVSATLYDVSLDLRPPPPRAEIAEDRRREGERALAYAGVQIDPRPFPAGGLAVASVEPGSRAERAGILGGDRIVRFDGVRVLALADATPSGARASATLGVRRGASAREEIVELPFDGFRSGAPRNLLAAACILGLAAVALLLLGGSSPAFVGWLEDQLTSVAIAGRGGRAGRFGAMLDRAIGPSPSIPRRRWSLAAAAFAAFAVPLVVSDIDVAVIWLVELSALATLAVVTRRGGARVARIATYALVRGASLVAIVIAAGSVRVVDVVRAQGGAPWCWNVFRVPVGWALFAAFVIPALPRSPMSRDGAPSISTSANDVFDALVLASSAALASALFFGGWELPWMAPGEQDARAAYRLLGCAMFVAKSAVIFGGLVALRAVLPELRERALVAIAWRTLVPAAGTAAAASVVWSLWGPGARVETVAGGVAIALTALIAAHFAHRLRVAARAPRLHVNPFL